MQTTPEVHIPLKEKLKSIPEIFGIRLNEEPSYQVLKKDGAFEVRQYGKQVIAQVSIPGSTYEDFKEVAFKKLANYIFGGNHQKHQMSDASPEDSSKHKEASEQIPMTSPVLQGQNEMYHWTMSFVLPAKFTIETAPTPDDSDIKLQEVEEYTVATIKYAGNNSLESIHDHEHQLAEWLAKHPQFTPEGKYFTAQYDGPMVIPFLKRNEIQVRVVSTQ